MPSEIYRVGVGINTNANTQLIVNKDGSTSRISTNQYAKTMQRHLPPSTSNNTIAKATNPALGGRRGTRAPRYAGPPAPNPYSTPTPSKATNPALGRRGFGVSRGMSANQRSMRGDARVRPTNTTPPAANSTPRVPNAGLRPGATSGNIVGRLPAVSGSALGALGVAQIAASGRREAIAGARAAGLLPPESPWQRAVREFEENPLPYLNPFSDKWDWAPWNDKNNPKGIKSVPSKTAPLIEDNKQPINAPNYPINFTYTVSLYDFDLKLPGGVRVNGFGVRGGYSYALFGIPVQIRYQTGQNRAVTIYVDYKTSATDTGLASKEITAYQVWDDGMPDYATGSDPDDVQISWDFGSLASPATRLEPIDIPKIPEPIYEETDLGKRPQVLEPPDGIPEFPVPARIPTYIRPLPQTNPPPKTAPRPRPLPPSNLPGVAANPLTSPQTAPEPQPDTTPGDVPGGLPINNPWRNPWPFPVSPVPPMPMPPPSSNPAGKLELIRRTTTTVNDPYAPSQRQDRKPVPKIPDVLLERLTGQSIPGIPQQSPESLGAKIDKLSEDIEEKTKRGCKYKEDDLVTANITAFNGVEPLTNIPKFTQTPIQVHEKLKDYIEFQSGVLARIEGQSDGLRGRIKRILDRLQITRILSLMSFAATIHNAAMLSKNLALTLGDVTSTVISEVGQLTGVLGQDETIDVNEILGKQFNQAMENAIGAEAWNGTKTTWNKANRIISSASQIIWTIRSINDSRREMLEWIGENTGKIGNALKRSGVVGERSYPWMPERFNIQTKWEQRITKFREGAENLDDAASSLQGVVSEVGNIQDEFNELKKQREDFEKLITDADKKVRVDNTSAKTETETAKAASKGKEVTINDMEGSDNATT